MPIVIYLAISFSVAAFLISVVAFFFFKSYLRRRTGQERILSELREEVDRILRTIDETTDRDISLIEEREQKLKTLLGEVDKRLQLYIRELEKRRDDENAHATITGRTRAAGQEAGGANSGADYATAYQELGRNRYRAFTPAASEAIASGRNRQSGDAALEPIQAAAQQTQIAPQPAPQTAAEQIRSLTRSGFAPTVIATRLGLSIAEVELVTALMERREGK